MSCPLVRVFVPTYRRAHLLPRALASLRAQTFQDWVAEVHNDAPDDPGPHEVVRRLADPRIQLVRHERTIGGTATFNLAFAEQRNPFVAILEDDNWWRPDFLQRMTSELQAHPDLIIAWANQSVWEENSVGEWRDTGRFVRPINSSAPAVRVSWPHLAQCLGGLHAHGTVLVRTRPGRSYLTPAMDLGGVEAVRERSFPHPMLYVPEPLGVFGATHVTHRSRDRSVWATHQVLLAATFMKHIAASDAYWHELWRRARCASPRMTGTLLLAARQDPALRRQLSWATMADWRLLAVRNTRRPVVFLKLLRARHRSPMIWQFLDTHTAQRSCEAAAAGITPACEGLAVLP